MTQHQDAQTAQALGGIAEVGEAKQQARDQLMEAIGEANDTLVSATTVFPFTLFPDTIAVDRAQITVVKRDFLKVGRVITMRIEDVFDIEATIGPVFGSLKITTRIFSPERPYVVNYLKRDDALKIKRIVQGYLIARRRNIDCSALSTEELAQMLDALGKATTQEAI